MNKIINSWNITSVGVLFFLILPFSGSAQDTALNKYGLWIIGTAKIYRETVKKDAGKEMVDLKKSVPGLVFDLKYASEVNFMKTKLYPDLATSYLRKSAATALALIQKELNRQGLRLLIFDAYRPYSITEKMWEPVKDDRYAADPKVGSGHNRGIAVDLTIIDLYTKDPLNMGTDFDNFTDSAHHDFTALPKEVLQNRSLLKNIMEKNGFKAVETEWWHYFFSAGQVDELLDISFEELKKLTSGKLIKTDNKNSL